MRSVVALHMNVDCMTLMFGGCTIDKLTLTKSRECKVHNVTRKHSSPCSGIIKRVDKKKRHRASCSTTGNVGGELEGLRSVLGGREGGLDGVLEGKVERLRREVPENISQVSCTCIFVSI